MDNKQPDRVAGRGQGRLALAKSASPSRSDSPFQYATNRTESKQNDAGMQVINRKPCSATGSLVVQPDSWVPATRSNKRTNKKKPNRAVGEEGRTEESPLPNTALNQQNVKTKKTPTTSTTSTHTETQNPHSDKNSKLVTDSLCLGPGRIAKSGFGGVPRLTNLPIP